MERIELLASRLQRELEEGREPELDSYIREEPGLDAVALRQRLEEVLSRHRARLAGQERSSQEVHIQDRLTEGYASDWATPFHSASSTPSGRTPAPTISMSGEAQDDSSSLAPSKGRFLGRFELQERLGRGGFGEVWRAFDHKLERSVALKFSRSGGDQAVAEIESEGRTLAKLQHPGIVRVYDVGCEQEHTFIVSELVAGGTLAARLARGKMDWREAAALVADVAEAAHAGHIAGLVHRDIKPANILIDESGRPRLADFGLAVTEEEQLSEPAAAVGSLAYMSPEQLFGHSNRVDARADIYALGMVLYEALTNRFPFVARTVAEYRVQVLERDPRPPRTIVDTIPVEVESVCLRCLHREAGERLTTALDLAIALRSALKAIDQPAAAPAAPAAVPPAIQVVVQPRSPWLMLGAGAAVLAAFVALLISLLAMRDPRGPKDVVQPNSGGGPDAASGPQVAALFDSGPHAPPTDVVTVSPLIWRKSEIQSGIQVLRDGQSLRSETGDTGLLECLTIGNQATRFEVDIQQVEWIGRVGVFFGYREEWKDSRIQGGFQAIMLQLELSGKWKVSRMFYEYNVDSNPHQWDSTYVASAYIDPPQKPSLTLRLDIAGGRFMGAFLDGEELLDLLPKDEPDDLEWSSSQGKAGLAFIKSNGTFSNLRISGEKRRFANDDRAQREDAADPTP